MPPVKRFWQSGAERPFPDGDLADLLFSHFDGYRVFLTYQGYQIVLAKDHIRHFISDADRGDKFGYLELTVHIYTTGYETWIVRSAVPAKPN